MSLNAPIDVIPNLRAVYNDHHNNTFETQYGDDTTLHNANSWMPLNMWLEACQHNDRRLTLLLFLNDYVKIQSFLYEDSWHMLALTRVLTRLANNSTRHLSQGLAFTEFCRWSQAYTFTKVCNGRCTVWKLCDIYHSCWTTNIKTE